MLLIPPEGKNIRHTNEAEGGLLWCGMGFHDIAYGISEHLLICGKVPAVRRWMLLPLFVQEPAMYLVAWRLLQRKSTAAHASGQPVM